MVVSQKAIIRKNRCMLQGKLKQSGFDRWRFFCRGRSESTGDEKMFFLELYVLNPGVSPTKVTFKLQKGVGIGTEDIQKVLTGTMPLENETVDQGLSSYVSVRAGALGINGRSIYNFFPSNFINHIYKVFNFKIGNCFFSEDTLSGRISISPEERLAHPEYMSDAGSVAWNLQYTRTVSFMQNRSSKKNAYFINGAASCFSGFFTIDGEEYLVLPNESYGYTDRNWGSTLPVPWFHLSSSNLTSIITNKKLPESCFVVQGVYNDKLSVFAAINGRDFTFDADSRMKKYDIDWECTQMPEDTETEKLHWSVSVHNHISVLDIDIFASAEELCIGNYEIPSGGEKILRTVRGGTAVGEIRLYRKIRKNLELIEHAQIANALCEYGVLEKP